MLEKEGSQPKTQGSNEAYHHMTVNENGVVKTVFIPRSNNYNEFKPECSTSGQVLAPLTRVPHVIEPIEDSLVRARLGKPDQEPSKTGQSKQRKRQTSEQQKKKKQTPQQQKQPPQESSRQQQQQPQNHQNRKEQQQQPQNQWQQSQNIISPWQQGQLPQPQNIFQQQVPQQMQQIGMGNAGNSNTPMLPQKFLQFNFSNPVQQQQPTQYGGISNMPNPVQQPAQFSVVSNLRNSTPQQIAQFGLVSNSAQQPPGQFSVVPSPAISMNNNVLSSGAQQFQSAQTSHLQHTSQIIIPSSQLSLNTNPNASFLPQMAQPSSVIIPSSQLPISTLQYSPYMTSSTLNIGQMTHNTQSIPTTVTTATVDGANTSSKKAVTSTINKRKATKEKNLFERWKPNNGETSQQQKTEPNHQLQQAQLKQQPSQAQSNQQLQQAQPNQLQQRTQPSQQLQQAQLNQLQQQAQPNQQLQQTQPNQQLQKAQSNQMLQQTQPNQQLQQAQPNQQLQQAQPNQQLQQAQPNQQLQQPQPNQQLQQPQPNQQLQQTQPNQPQQIVLQQQLGQQQQQVQPQQQCIILNGSQIVNLINSPPLQGGVMSPPNVTVQGIPVIQSHGGGSSASATSTSTFTISQTSQSSSKTKADKPTRKKSKQYKVVKDSQGTRHRFRIIAPQIPTFTLSSDKKGEQVADGNLGDMNEKNESKKKNEMDSSKCVKHSLDYSSRGGERRSRGGRGRNKRRSRKTHKTDLCYNASTRVAKSGERRSTRKPKGGVHYDENSDSSDFDDIKEKAYNEIPDKAYTQEKQHSKHKAREKHDTDSGEETECYHSDAQEGEKQAERRLPRKKHLSPGHVSDRNMMKLLKQLSPTKDSSSKAGNFNPHYCKLSKDACSFKESWRERFHLIVGSRKRKVLIQDFNDVKSHYPNLKSCSVLITKMKKDS